MTKSEEAKVHAGVTLTYNAWKKAYPFCIYEVVYRANTLSEPEGAKDVLKATAAFSNLQEAEEYMAVMKKLHPDKAYKMTSEPLQVKKKIEREVNLLVPKAPKL